jgi:hypothetical protein
VSRSRTQHPINAEPQARMQPRRCTLRFPKHIYTQPKYIQSHQTFIHIETLGFDSCAHLTPQAEHSYLGPRPHTTLSARVLVVGIGAISIRTHLSPHLPLWRPRPTTHAAGNHALPLQCPLTLNAQHERIRHSSIRTRWCESVDHAHRLNHLVNASVQRLGRHG